MDLYRMTMGKPLGTVFIKDPNGMVAFGISCANRKRKKLKGWQKNNKRK